MFEKPSVSIYLSNKTVIMEVLRTLLTGSVLCLVLCLDTTSSTKLVNQYSCHVKNKWYALGGTFYHQFSSCEYKCECKTKSTNGYSLPVAECIHKCPDFHYPPYCCEPVSDGCCPSSYVCKTGECCMDENTSTLYKVGDTWVHNSTCNCTCLGMQRGIKKCECGPHKDECVPDERVTCTVCPSDITNCPVRKKCDKWIYNHKATSTKYVCTCLDNKTHCKKDVISTRRKRRSSSEAPEEFEISEGWTKRVQGADMRFEL